MAGSDILHGSTASRSTTLSRRMWCCTEDLERANQMLAPTASWPRPLLVGVGPVPFPALQGMFDGLYPPGLQWYWKADFVDHLSDEAIAEHVKFGAEMPTLHCNMRLHPSEGGGIGRSKQRTKLDGIGLKARHICSMAQPQPAGVEAKRQGSPRTAHRAESLASSRAIPTNLFWPRAFPRSSARRTKPAQPVAPGTAGSCRESRRRPARGNTIRSERQGGSCLVCSRTARPSRLR